MRSDRGAGSQNMFQRFRRGHKACVGPFEAPELHFFAENALPLPPPAIGTMSRQLLLMGIDMLRLHVAGVLECPEKLVHVPLSLVRDSYAKLAWRVKMKNAEGAGTDAAVVLQRMSVCNVKLIA